MKQKNPQTFKKEKKMIFLFTIKLHFQGQKSIFNQIKLIFGLVLQGVSPSEFVS